MLIAIHSSTNSFHNKWISYCKENQISFKIVDCYKSDIIQQLKDCHALMWHFHHANQKDVKFAKQLLYALQAAGKKVFPDYNTVWHFDDKVGQKYLLEAIGAPLIPTYVFYSKADALQWAGETKFPKVFKLRAGAGSANVRLVGTRKQAIKLINKAFGSGFRQYNPGSGLKERWLRFKLGETNFRDLAEGVGRFFIRTDFERAVGEERGYVYFQDFIEGCQFDIRAKVIDKKCWAFKRIVRENDFRASGSNKLVYSRAGIPLELIKTALELSNKLHLQCVAFDFILSENDQPLLIEMSYGFGFTEDQFYGYWDSELNWHEGNFNPFGWMVDSLITEVKNTT